MTIAQIIEEYVTVKRATGLRFRSAATILRTCARVAGVMEINDVTQDTVWAFLKRSGPITSGWHQKHYTLAGLFRFAMQRGLVSTSPVAYRVPKRPAYATPYIYSEEELRRMLDATSALDLPHPKNGQPATIPALTFRTLILLLYGAGLRLGEALALTLDDVDLHTNILLVRNTKFFKTRWVPIGPRLSWHQIDQLEIERVAPDVVRRFLAHLEVERHCSVSTRNQRLAAIHAFARFIGARSPEHLAWCAELTAIPFKKAAKGTLRYLEKPEMDALLAAPDRRTSQGARDHAVLLFLYNAGARADEAARLTVADLDLGTSPAAKLLGKGNKTRLCPLWPSTAGVLKTVVATRGGHEPVFLNRRREAVTRFGIYDLVKRHAARAAQRVPSIAAKRVSPHVIRHTTAVHLLRAGVDINTIRTWLGHVSLDTTNIYAEVDLAMKAKALGECSIPDDSRRHWRKEPGLMAFLRSL